VSATDRERVIDAILAMDHERPAPPSPNFGIANVMWLGRVGGWPELPS
jgi:hypothetical protein